jgi:nickel transport protein
MRSATSGLAVFLALAAACAAPARAHGVRTEVAVGATTVVTVTHEDGSPLAGTPFTVLAPGRAAPYLEGATDRHGRVVFLPDAVGAWKVRIAAADGHGAVVTVEVDSAALRSAGSAPAAVREPDHDPAQDHDHAHGADHAHDTDHAHSAPQGSADRWFDAAAGLAVLVAVLAVAALVARRRRR